MLKIFQVEYDDEGLLVDRLLPTLVHCCSRASAELLGLVKLPLLLLLVFLGQVSDKILASNDHLDRPGAQDGDQQRSPPRLRPPPQTSPRLSSQPHPLSHLLPSVQPVKDGRSNFKSLLSNHIHSSMEICPQY